MPGIVMVARRRWARCCGRRPRSPRGLAFVLSPR